MPGGDNLLPLPAAASRNCRIHANSRAARVDRSGRIHDRLLDALGWHPGHTLGITAVGRGCEASIDCSGSGAARVVALENTRTWGRCVFVGEGGHISFPVSELLIHKQSALHGSRMTSLRHREELLEHLVRWDLH